MVTLAHPVTRTPPSGPLSPPAPSGVEGWQRAGARHAVARRRRVRALGSTTTGRVDDIRCQVNSPDVDHRTDAHDAAGNPRLSSTVGTGTLKPGHRRMDYACLHPGRSRGPRPGDEGTQSEALVCVYDPATINVLIPFFSPVDSGTNAHLNHGAIDEAEGQVST